VVAGKQRLMPFFNHSNNEDLILAIQSAGVSRGRNGFFFRSAAKALRDNRKDKSGEPLARCNLITTKARRNGSLQRSRLRSKNTCSNTAPTAPTLSIPSGAEKFRTTTLLSSRYQEFHKFFCKFAPHFGTSLML